MTTKQEIRKRHSTEEGYCIDDFAWQLHGDGIDDDAKLVEE